MLDTIMQYPKLVGGFFVVWVIYLLIRNYILKDKIEFLEIVMIDMEKKGVSIMKFEKNVRIHDDTVTYHIVVEGGKEYTLESGVSIT